jgi:hypothetical protein
LFDPFARVAIAVRIVHQGHGVISRWIVQEARGFCHNAIFIGAH